MTSVRLPADLDTQLSHLCAMTRRPRSFYIKEALSRYLEDIADYYITADRASRPKRKLLSTEEVIRALEKEK